MTFSVRIPARLNIKLIVALDLAMWAVIGTLCAGSYELVQSHSMISIQATRHYAADEQERPPSLPHAADQPHKV